MYLAVLFALAAVTQVKVYSQCSNPCPDNGCTHDADSGVCVRDTTRSVMVPAYTSQQYTTTCGFLDLDRCTRYRQVSKTVYKSVLVSNCSETYCCDGYQGNAATDRGCQLTRYVAIGRQSVVRLPEQVPVKLDCRPLAVAAYGDQLNTSSIEWFRGGQLVTGGTRHVYTITISESNLCLLIDALVIASGAQDGSEAEYTCMACTNESSSPPECRNFTSRLVASSPPLLECADPVQPDFDPNVAIINIGCDLCIEETQAVFLTSLSCEPTTNRLPTNCTIRNPDGLTAEQISDGITISSSGSTLTLANEIVKNPEDPLPPKVLGTWTCTCINVDGQATAETKIGSCSVCRRPCQNGGTCTAPDVCTCADGWTGRTCNRAVCKTKCRNGGRCTGPDQCTCRAQWTGKICQQRRRQCTPSCAVGGKCLKNNMCVYPSTYTCVAPRAPMP